MVVGKTKLRLSSKPAQRKKVVGYVIGNLEYSRGQENQEENNQKRRM